MSLPNTNSPWSTVEIAAAVHSYLSMWALEQAGQKYKKSDYRKALFEQLQSLRSNGSIEFKYCNISAVMELLQYPSIRGYKPRHNFQKSLLQEVEQQLSSNSALHLQVQAAVNLPAQVTTHYDFQSAVQTAPQAMHQVREELAEYAVRSPVRRDYLAQEARNQSLGLAGEKFVLAYERWRLRTYGFPGLADRVVHVSVDEGDGHGFDVRSFDINGDERWIEVKTTSYAKETPFFISHNELQVSQVHTEKFHLYRVYEFREKPKFFVLPGDIQQHCQLDAVSYRASF